MSLAKLGSPCVYYAYSIVTVTDTLCSQKSSQVECPDLVRVWKVALRGRDSNTDRIYNWRIEGSNDGVHY